MSQNRRRRRQTAVSIVAATHRASVESLETRRLLSAAVKSTATSLSAAFASTFVGPLKLSDIVTKPNTDISKAAKVSATTAYTQYATYYTDADAAMQPFAANPPGSARTPAQIRKSYGLNNLTFGGISGDGTGQTIAIVDAYDNPSFVSDTDPNYGISDLVQFSNYFNLGLPASFKKYNQSGVEGNYPTYNSGWAGEIALDIEWAHAMAPKASIVLVEASSSGTSAMLSAVNTAKNLPGVTAVSMSYGGGEVLSQESSYIKSGVTFFASSGDTGGALSYPSSSVNVVGVGGTTLNQSDGTGTWSSETAWNGSGGGTGGAAKPSFQNILTSPDKTPSTTKRTAPDVAANANPSTGVAVLDTSAIVNASGFNANHVSPPANGWVNGSYGGTSLSSPMWAGFMSVVNQGRSLLGLGSLSGNTQTLPRLYTLNSSTYHDVVSGSAGSFSATTGYDLITGRGTPTGSIYANLAGGANITGSIYVDKNSNGALDGTDFGISDASVYLDLNNNGSFDSTFEPTTTTNASGQYTFADQVGGVTFNVRTTLPSGYFALTALNKSSTTVYGVTNSNVSFGFFPTSLSGPAFTLKLNGANEEFYASATASGSPDYTVPMSVISGGYTINATGGSDVLNIDLSGTGTPVPTGDLIFANTTASDSVIVTGSSGADAVSLDNSDIHFGALNVHYGSAGTLTLNLGGGNDTLNWDGASVSAASVLLSGGSGTDTLNILSGTWKFNSDAQLTTDNLSVNVSSGASAVFNTTQHLAGLSAAGTGSASVAAGGDKTFVIRSLSLSDGGTLDLNDNDAIVDYSGTGVSPLASIEALIKAARNGGAWNGAGLTSLAAKDRAAHNTTLGAISAADYYALYGSNAAFNLEPTNSQEVIIKYTYYGDANFNGKLDGGDYGRVDATFNKEHSAGNIGGWANGDFNYDGKIDGADYGLIDAAFNSQLGVLQLIRDREIRSNQ